MTNNARGLDRRTLLKAALGGAAGLGAVGATPSPVLADTPMRMIPPQALGMHLYTMRRSLAVDTPAVYAALADIGYGTVGVSGRHGYTAKQIRSIADDVGLKIVLEHVGFNRLTDNWQGAIDDVLTLGGKWIVVPSIPGSLHSPDGYRQAAQMFNEAGLAARDNDLGLLFHNHASDHATVEGEVLFDILVNETDPHLFNFELDTYWTVQGGADPIFYFVNHPRRFPVLHVKDRTADGRFADPGYGTLDFAAMFDHARTAGVKQWLVENDGFSDTTPEIEMQTAQRSYDYLSTLRY